MERVLVAVAPSDDAEGERLCGELIDAFEDADCDTLDECLGVFPAYDRAHAKRHPIDEDDEYPDPDVARDARVDDY